MFQIQFIGGSCVLYLLYVKFVQVSGFQTGVQNSRISNGVCRPLLLLQSSTSQSRRLSEVSDFERPSTFLDGGDDDEDENDRINIVFIDDDDDDDKEKDEDRSDKNGIGRKRWENLRPNIKKRLIEKGQAKAIANKQKREPAADKKRRMMLKFKELQREKKRDSRVKRPLGLDQRAPLTAFFPGMEVTGTVISLTKYGAYVDVGTECDGLLHISQITRKFFVEHPRQVLAPGDEVTVKIRSTSPELKKMHLTMLDGADVEDNFFNNDKDDNEEGTPLKEFEIDDELWGELKRVTDFGAYIEVGAEVDGFLHFMDHPLWEDGMTPNEFMERGQRVRVWVADLDMGKNRIRVTACRPQNLPGPKFEL